MYDVSQNNNENTQNLKTSKYYVAFLDILGAKYYMSMNDSKFLNDINNIYNESLQLLNKIETKLKQKISVKIFSDNILLAVKLNIKEEFEKEKFERLINLAGLIQNVALKYGYLIRGAITCGDFYIKKTNSIETFVYGKALVEAYNLESSIALYPRIIIRRKDIYSTKQMYIVPAPDDYYYINYYFFSMSKNFNTFKQNLMKMLNQNKRDEKVRQKIMRAINYHNEYFKDEFPNNSAPNIPEVKPTISRDEIHKCLI